MSNESLHPTEEKTRAAQPDLGSSDVSECLPGWIKTFCEQFEAEEGLDLSQSAVNALGHTLIAARVRQERLVKERDEVLDALLDMFTQHAITIPSKDGTASLYHHGCLTSNTWSQMLLVKHGLLKEEELARP